MTDEKNSRPKSLNFLIAGVLFQGLSGLLGGTGLILDPSGESLSIPLEWLQGSPFDSYFIPGLILLLSLGVFPLLVSYWLWTVHKWSWVSAMLVGLMLIMWILIEIIIIGYQPSPPLQLIYGLLGIFITSLVWFPNIRKYLNEYIEAF